MSKKNFPAEFLNGYRAYVLGGKIPIYNKHRAPIAYKGGWDAPKEMSLLDKKLWRAGVKYAIKEKKKCLAIQRNTLVRYNKNALPDFDKKHPEIKRLKITF